jgi:hypothetical protein
MKMFTLFDVRISFGSKGYLANAVNTTKINKPRRKYGAISDTPINHLSPTVPGITILKKINNVQLVLQHLP